MDAEEYQFVADNSVLNWKEIQVTEAFKSLIHTSWISQNSGVIASVQIMCHGELDMIQEAENLGEIVPWDQFEVLILKILLPHANLNQI